MPFRYRNVDDVIRRLEEIKYRLDQNDDYLNKTRLTMFELRKNNCNLRKGLDDHLVSMQWMADDYQ